MNGFRLTPDEMSSAAGVFDSCAGEIQTTKERINTTAESLSAGWENAGFEQFSECFQEYNVAAAKMVEVLEQNSRALRSSAQLAQDTADKLTSIWS